MNLFKNVDCLRQKKKKKNSTSQISHFNDLVPSINLNSTMRLRERNFRKLKSCGGKSYFKSLQGLLFMCCLISNYLSSHLFCILSCFSTFHSLPILKTVGIQQAAFCGYVLPGKENKKKFILSPKIEPIF